MRRDGRTDGQKREESGEKTEKVEARRGVVGRGREEGFRTEIERGAD